VKLPTWLRWLHSDLHTNFNLRIVVVHVDLPSVEDWRWNHDLLCIVIDLVIYYSQQCQSLMIVSVANSISKPQQGLTLAMLQSSANKSPFANRIVFSVIQFNAMIRWGCICMGLFIGLKVLVSIVIPNPDIDTSEFSFGYLQSSVISTIPWVHIRFIPLFCQHLYSDIRWDSSSDTCSDSGRALTKTLTVARTAAKLWQ